MKHTKEVFLQTACELFAEKGYHATGIADILKKSGAPKGSLYYYFPGGKEELAAEALQLTTGKILQELGQDVLVISPTSAALQAHFRLLAKKMKEKTFRSQLSITLMALENWDCPSLLEICKGFYQQVEDMYYEKLLGEGYDQQRAKVKAMFIVSLIEGSISLALTHEDGGFLEVMGEHVEQELHN